MSSNQKHLPFDTMAARSRPSTRTPCGVTSTEKPAGGAVLSGSAATATRRSRGRVRGS